MLAATFAACVALAVVMAQEALEERQNAAAAADLRHAVLTLASADAAAFDGDDLEAVLLRQAAATVDGDIGDALHALEPQHQAQARSELAVVRSHVAEMKAGDEVQRVEHSLVAHGALQASLRDASLTAATDAASSERLAVIALIVAAAAVAGMTFMALRTRTRTSEIKVQSETYRDAASRLGALLDQSATATLVIGEAREITYASRALEAITPHLPRTSDGLARVLMGADAAELHDAMQTDDVAELAIVTQLHDDRLDIKREFFVRAANMRDDPVVQGVFVTFTETTSDSHSRRQLQHLADHDQLTGLPNRRSLGRRLDGLDQNYSLLMIDLDGFKQTNDTFGHAGGDELLVRVSERFLAQLSPHDYLHRLGGDEFAVVSVGEPQAAVDLAHRLVKSLADPIKLEVGFERTTASIGIATNDSSDSRLSILRRADIALYDAKEKGGGDVEILSDAMEQRSVWTSSVARSLELTHVETEFHLVVQPIVDAETHEVRMLEALARWTSPELGPVPPDVFITLAEESGQIDRIGDWVLDHAVAALAAMCRQGMDDTIGMTVNVSPVQLTRSGFADRVAQTLERHQVRAERLTIELTESAVVSRGPQISAELMRLRSLGCLIACDDFGSGYSNLGQLMEMPLDVLKIDRMLLTQLSEMRRQMGDSPDTPCQVMSAIVSIAEAMDAITVGEGVETAQQAESLRASGVQLLQGYFFGRPVTVTEYIASLGASGPAAGPAPLIGHETALSSASS